MSILISICIFISILFIIFFIIGFLDVNIINFKDKKIRKYNYIIGRNINGNESDIIDSTYTPTFETCAKFLGTSKVPAIADYNKFSKQCILYKLFNNPNGSILFNNKWISNKTFRTSTNGKATSVKNISSNKCKKIHNLYNSDFTTYKNKKCTVNTFLDSNSENYIIIPDNMSITTPYIFNKLDSNKGYISIPNSEINTINKKYNDTSSIDFKSIDDCALYFLEKQNYELLFNKNKNNIPILAKFDNGICNLYKYDTNNKNIYKFNNKITKINLGYKKSNCKFIDKKNINSCMKEPTSEKTYIVWNDNNECYECSFEPSQNNNLIFNNSSTHI